jgi:aromatic-amino-acid transaminase
MATMQTVGSSGGLKVGADFLKRWFPDSQVWVSDPTWDNHRAMFEGAGSWRCAPTRTTTPATGGLRFDAMLRALRHAAASAAWCCCTPAATTPPAWT